MGSKDKCYLSTMQLERRTRNEVRIPWPENGDAIMDDKTRRSYITISALGACLLKMTVKSKQDAEQGCTVFAFSVSITRQLFNI